MADTVTYFHNDISGSPLAATDASGNLLWKENYKPYGEKLNQAAPSGSNKIGFHGKAFDDDTGLSYMGARYYDPMLGRFMGVDPVDFQEDSLHSFNRYTFANNNPYKYVDPNGEFAFLAIPVIQFAVAAVAAVSAGYVAKGVINNVVNGASSTTLGTPPFTGIEIPATNVYSSEKESNSSGERSKDTLKPGDFAGESIPARGPGRDFSQGERDAINEIGRETGCHTCGNTDPGTKSGNHIPDHQPANALNPTGGDQRLYPHCIGCSRVQGGQVRGATRRNQ
ncbi:RHS repeat domain-containing protein [Pseudomonas capsici]|uniref:RHS repeat domain-containing protein n=1 Tax=Pseudomonas capsici TaxID=2810614 RepID=UPI00384C9F80